MGTHSNIICIHIYYLFFLGGGRLNLRNEILHNEGGLPCGVFSFPTQKGYPRKWTHSFRSTMLVGNWLGFILVNPLRFD